MNSNRLIRPLGVTAVVAALVIAAPLAANAHIRVDPGQATPGSYSTLTFKVPTESATANTVKLEIDLPTATPFGSVSYQPIPGWTTEVVNGQLPTPITTDGGVITDAPVKVIWTADVASGAGIAPGQFQRFAISVGPVPETGSILLPAHQTYSDGTVVDWVDPTPADGTEPELPAPTLYVQDAPPAEEAMAGAAMTGTEMTASTVAVNTTATADAASPESPLAVGLGIAGLVLGALALVVSALAFTRKSRPAGATSNSTTAGK
jgi:uncharacterized protein YcnI